jgi:GDP-L-fucose synthase
MKKIYIAGHRGMVGAALLRAVPPAYDSVLVADRAELDLLDQGSVYSFLKKHTPDVVIIAAAKVGGIHANSTYPGDFIFQNLTIAANLIEGSRRAGVHRLLNLGSSCIYPKHATQPMPESCLLTSELEPTNEAYAIAKIAALKMCQHYRAQYGLLYHSAMPTNLYGTGDNYHAENSHVIPAMLRRFHEAKVNGAPEVVIWGSGKPRREFLYVDDLAHACYHLLSLDHPADWVNVGTGQDLSIRELAETIAAVTGYQGRLAFDTTKPDGTPRKLLDISFIEQSGWRPRVALKEGLELAYQDFCDSLKRGAVRM